MQPLKPNFNPGPTKLLQQEWMFQRHLELETLLYLQKFGNFPVEKQQPWTVTVWQFSSRSCFIDVSPQLLRHSYFRWWTYLPYPALVSTMSVAIYHWMLHLVISLLLCCRTWWIVPLNTKMAFSTSPSRKRKKKKIKWWKCPSILPLLNDVALIVRSWAKRLT